MLRSVWCLRPGFLMIRLVSFKSAFVGSGFREKGIVILKGLPVLQCGNCPEYLIEDAVLAQVDQILQRVDTGKELEIVPYAA
jgi:hypothetical protein